MFLATITGLARALPLPIGYAAADLASEAHRWLSPARRNAVAENLLVLTGGNEPPGAVSRVFRNYGRSLLELLRGPDLPEIGCHFVGREHLDAARRRGRGVVVCLPHTGSWSVCGARLASEGLPITAVANVQLRPQWTPELRRRQRADGLRVLGPGVSSSREMLRVLRRNEVLALLVDGDVFRGGTPVEIAGRQVSFPAGPARLAAATGAALLPGFGRRNPDGTLSFTFLPEIPVAPDGAQAPASAMREIGIRLEQVLRDDPAQWMIFRRFFAGSQPAAEPARAVVGTHPAGMAA